MTPTGKLLVGVGVVATGLAGAGVVAHYKTASAAAASKAGPGRPTSFRVATQVDVQGGGMYVVVLNHGRALALTAPEGATLNYVPPPGLAADAYVSLNGQPPLPLTVGATNMRVSWVDPTIGNAPQAAAVGVRVNPG